MNEWPPPAIFPDRRRPHRLPRDEYQRLFQPVFFAACTKDRRPVLLHASFPRVLRTLLDDNARANRCHVIAWCLMPDHLHVLACVVSEGGDVLSFFTDFKRGSANAALRAGLQTLWQRDFWDRHTRNDVDLWRCIRYILRNPVEEGLCERPEQWPHAEFRGYPWRGGTRQRPRGPAGRPLRNDNGRART